MKPKCEHCGKEDENLNECNTPSGKAMLCFDCMYENSDVMRVYLTNILPSKPQREEYTVEKQLGLPYPGKKKKRRKH